MPGHGNVRRQARRQDPRDAQVRSRLEEIIKVWVSPEHGEAEKELFEKAYKGGGFPSIWLLPAAGGPPGRISHQGPGTVSEVVGASPLCAYMQHSVSKELTLVVSLFLHPGRKADLEEFERSASSIMSRYGGRIERRISLPSHDNPSQPDEVHVVHFPDQDSFDRYRRDPEVQALAELRARAIRQTIVWQGVDSPPWVNRRREPA